MLKDVFGETPKTAVETTALPENNCMVPAKTLAHARRFRKVADQVDA